MTGSHVVAPPRRKYPTQPLASERLTNAERDLARLCRLTFLSLSSYPNTYRAERQPNGGVIGKEQRLRQAMRSMLYRPGFTLVVGLTLATAIGANATICLRGDDDVCVGP